MTVPIDVPAALIVLVSCAVAYVVHRHTRETSTTVPKTGDLGIAIGAGLAALTALSFLFGISADRDNGHPSQLPAVSVTGPPASGTGEATGP
ncbi:hypothetical protein [Streptomyces sp. NRRL F-525]|uniref:hypothetical protein n=1 Tax=Streptomyces sp. NRRL F-525 TaxID=1463861 RepID=UPI00052493BF|nr:hypothetical protein [Streptomyces sp. NRRL F-525]